MNRPNILLLCAEMIGAKYFGCYGDQAVVTPNVDSLAEGGVRFDQAYCSCPPCIPTRVSMMSGLYGHTHGKMAHMQMELLPRPALIPEILSRHGYRTGLVGKTHWWPPTDTLGCDIAHITIDNHLTYELGDNDAYIQFLVQRGLFHYTQETWEQEKHRLDPDNLPFDCLKVNWTGDTACSLLDELSGGEEPFFMFCSFVETHCSIEEIGAGSVQKEYLEKFRDIPLRPIIGRDGEHDDKPDVQKRAVAHWRALLSGKDLDRERRTVYASLNLVDENIGKVLNKLDQLGLRDNTIVILLADHGDLLFDHGCLGKTFLYEPAIRIPWIMAGPGLPQGEERKHLVNQIDLLPTILELCGIEEEDLAIEGRSMVPILADPENAWREVLFCETEQTANVEEGHFVSSCAAKMMRRGPWKYIYTLVDGHVVEEELYNLDIDPDELYNLAHDFSQLERTKGFRSEILRWLVATEVNRLHPIPENHYPVPKVDKLHF